MTNCKLNPGDKVKLLGSLNKDLRIEAGLRVGDTGIITGSYVMPIDEDNIIFVNVNWDHDEESLELMGIREVDVELLPKY